MIQTEHAGKRLYKGITIDVRTGKVLRSQRLLYDGSIARAANVRPPKGVPTWDQIAQQANPASPNQPEAIPWTWYDRQAYVSGTTVSLDFFQTVNADKTVGNMQAAGQIPAPMYFAIHHIGVYPLVQASVTNTGAAAAVATGADNDMQILIQGNFVLVIADKKYFETKIYMVPPGAGSVSQGVSMAGTFTAPQVDRFETAPTNGAPDLRNRFYHWGMLLIPHNQNFRSTLAWTAALTLAGGNTQIETVLDGYLYRRVL